MNLFLLKEWLIYFHEKTDEHSLHSPFFYHFYKNFLQKDSRSTKFESIELKRKQLLRSEEIIKVDDFGAGSKIMNSSGRKVKNIARHSLSSSKFSRLLCRLINHYKMQEVVELGTSLGINTAYLSKANPGAMIYTFEGDEKLLNIARKVAGKVDNLQFIHGNIDKTLPAHLQQRNKKIDLVYADANHTYEATVRYFHQLLPYHHAHSIFIFDDIHWSEGMKKAWNEIKEHPAVSSSLDIFDAGILFFEPGLQKQHFTLHF